MSILIKNMEMPKDGETVTLTICADGITFEEFKELGNVFCAVPVPPHGRLIDADALIRQMEQMVKETNNVRYAWIDELGISLAPTIIPAEEDE